MTAEIRAVPRSIEVPLVIAIALIAIIFRFAQFNQVPPGLHYDEAIDAKLARDIRAGVTPIYFEEGWGREPLYHYLVALTLNFTPDPTTALRVTSGVLGLIQLAAAYLLFRSLFGIPTALLGAAWIAVLFWTVSTSRAGLRNITLTTLTTLTAWAFWRVWDDARSRMQDARSGMQDAGRTMQAATSVYLLPPASCILPGVLLGLTIYTYQPGRVVPLIYLVFGGFVALRQRALIKLNWRALAVFFGVALVVALPLMIFLITHPQAETARAFQTEPIHALFAGNFQPAIETAVATLKMFTFDGAGDPQILYNLSGRPIFIGLGTILFYLGLIACVRRWKQPEYAFMLIWLIVTLLPNMLTAPAPFFYRAIAAQTPVALLPALGVMLMVDIFNRDGARRAKRIVAGVAFSVGVVALGQTAITTWRDYFEVWGQHAEVRFQYSAALTAIARTIDAAPDQSPVAVSSFFIEDADPIIFEQTLNRRDVTVRWFDARDSIIAAAGANWQWLGVPSFTPLDAGLQTEFPGEPLTTTQDFKLYALNAVRFRQSIEAWTCAACPVTFDQAVALIGLEYSVVDRTLIVQSAWRVKQASKPVSTAIFMHLIGSEGQIAAQDDRLGVPPHTWQPGDEFVQVHRIPLGQSSSGKYTLRLGLYNRTDNVRWAATDRSGANLDDAVTVATIEVSP
ncbi:MAG: glycosyltransferase family 39 protein [Chloroflexi bacterium]|nr:glycosyltransferase family 39 protein [Chloroflexota bacterium]